MTRKYYSLLTKAEDGRWYVQFGDYKKSVVAEERDSMVSKIARKDTRIITTGSKQSYINAAVAALNAEIAT